MILTEPHLITSKLILKFLSVLVCCRSYEEMLSWFCFCSTTRCLGTNLADASCMPKFFKIVTHNHRKITMSFLPLLILSVINVHAPRQWMHWFFNKQQCRWASDNDGHLPAILGYFKPSDIAHPTHMGQAYGYSLGTTFYIFSQEIYLLTFFRLAAQFLLFSLQRTMYFIMLYFWFIKYSYLKKNGALKYKCQLLGPKG